jgi:hypothetical protein
MHLRALVIRGQIGKRLGGFETEFFNDAAAHGVNLLRILSPVLSAAGG